MMEANPELTERVAKLESKIEHLEKYFERHLDNDFKEVRAIALANGKLRDWAMGAAALAGAMLPVVYPKIIKALGLS